MAEIKITASVTSSKLVNLYNIYINQSQEENVKLTIPIKIDKYRFGLLADFLKFIITLNNKTQIAVLKINGKADDLDSLYDQEYAYPIISLLWNSTKFVDKDGQDIKYILRDKQNIFFTKMNSLLKIKGNKYILINTDHLPESKGSIKLLESVNGFNVNENQVVNGIAKIINNYVLTLNKNNKNEIRGIVDDVSSVVYELLKNTYEWGKTRSDLVELSSSIRGLYIRFHNNNNNKAIEEYKNTPLEEFLKHPLVLNNCINESGQMYYLEIMVFDSGVGFIDRFTPRDCYGDLEIIKKCLIKNQTSSKSILKTKKGLGLDRILNILNGKGFIRIDTDKYSVCRDLIKDNYKPIDVNNLSELVLDDWNKTNFSYFQLVKPSGTFISIMYPFKSMQ
ncbi:hypothetical protein [Siphonobacter sp. SORGH_AS_0500]|uniref:hypothetical protein n=1 Tax=Siphonobacter sp. SORGH_AS_0500 TaxID=1864824 RepID=UPI002865C326|nr:hypothetical protein [Siphonobacter sp. SORGH_AS_0500]MDR6196696.1 hypothetical protein [Siphonobacter sp. SORGH_AS_0500]